MPVIAPSVPASVLPTSRVRATHMLAVNPLIDYKLQLDDVSHRFVVVRGRSRTTY
jgi:hypothetical protein